MTKSEKLEEKNKKILKVIKVFLENEDYSIIEISKETGISKSSVQRYLMFSEVERVTTTQIASYITKKIKENKRNGAVLGGVNSKKNNIFIKDQSGKFMGSVKNINKA